jgi:hypothetical protein
LDSSRQEIAHGHPSFLPDGTHFIWVRLLYDDAKHAKYQRLGLTVAAGS